MRVLDLNYKHRNIFEIQHTPIFTLPLSEPSPITSILAGF